MYKDWKSFCRSCVCFKSFKMTLQSSLPAECRRCDVGVSGAVCLAYLIDSKCPAYVRPESYFPHVHGLMLDKFSQKNTSELFEGVEETAFR